MTKDDLNTPRPIAPDPERTRPRLAIVVPCFNEELVLGESARRMGAVLRDLREKGRIASESFIEHLSRPDLYIAKLAEHMDSGALLAITTGDFGSLNAQMRRTKWRLMHPPTHAHYFSLASIGTLLERFGFELVYRRHCGFYRSLKSMAYGVFDQRHGSPLVGNVIQRLGIGD